MRWYSGRRKGSRRWSSHHWWWSSLMWRRWTSVMQGRRRSTSKGRRSSLHRRRTTGRPHDGTSSSRWTSSSHHVRWRRTAWVRKGWRSSSSHHRRSSSKGPSRRASSSWKTHLKLTDESTYTGKSEQQRSSVFRGDQSLSTRAVDRPSSSRRKLEYRTAANAVRPSPDTTPGFVQTRRARRAWNSTANFNRFHSMVGWLSSLPPS